MNALQLLKKDHQEVMAIIDRLLETSATAKKTREQLFEELKKRLIVHEHAEEKYFYPRLRNENETKPLVLESLEEHHVVNVILKDFNIPVDDESWIPRLKVLKENLQHHINEEENHLFPQADELLDHEEIEVIGDKISELKEREMH